MKTELEKLAYKRGRNDQALYDLGILEDFIKGMKEEVKGLGVRAQLSPHIEVEELQKMKDKVEYCMGAISLTAHLINAIKQIHGIEEAEPKKEEKKDGKLISIERQ